MAGQQAAGGSEVQNALALGWVIADLFYTQMPTPNTPDQSIALDLPSPSELRPMARAGVSSIMLGSWRPGSV